MATVHVQFLDDTKSKVTTCFSSPQDPEVWPNAGDILTSDPRWKEFYESFPDWQRAGLPLPDVPEGSAGDV